MMTDLLDLPFLHLVFACKIEIEKMMTCSRSMSAMAAASSLSKMDSTSGSRRQMSSLSTDGGGECGGVGVDNSSGRWPGCCEGGGGGGGLWAGVSVGVADILLAALKSLNK